MDDFRTEIQAQIRRATASGVRHLEINSGELHRKLGGYPGTNHRMPMCCDAMYGEMRDGDVIVAQAPKRKGATLKIRYLLLRPQEPPATGKVRDAGRD